MTVHRDGAKEGRGHSRAGVLQRLRRVLRELGNRGRWGSAMPLARQSMLLRVGGQGDDTAGGQAEAGVERRQ